MNLSSEQIRRLAPERRDLARALIEGAKNDVRTAMEIAVRLANDESVGEVQMTMKLSQAEYTRHRLQLQRALTQVSG